MRTTVVDVTFRLTIKADEDVEISDILNEMEFSLIDTTTKATFENERLVDYEVIDSR